MPGPSFVAGNPAPAVWSNVTSPKTAAVTLTAGDVLVHLGGTADSVTTLNTPTGGSSLSWTLQRTVNTTNYPSLYAWTTATPSSQSFTLQQTKSGDVNPFWGFSCLQFSGSNGIGNTAVTNTTGAPSLAITTTQANSAIVVFVLDWNAVDGASRAWRTPAGATAIVTGGAGEVSYYRNNLQYAVYVGYHADAGAAGSKTVGLSAPAGQQYAICAVEVLGTTTTPPSPPIYQTSQYGGFH